MNERELFEEWHYKEYSDNLEWCESKKEYKDYIDEAMWQAWQASANRQGYKLVPVEPNDNMKLAAYKQYDTGLSSMADIYKAMIGALK